VLTLARREPSAVLFAAQLASLLVYPAMEGNQVGQALFSVLGIAILGLVVRAVRASPAWTWLGIALAIPASVLLLIQIVTGSNDLQPWSSAFEAPLYFYAAGALIAYMLADHDITRDELFAVGATFTLVAWGFAYLYVVCQAAAPESFTAAVDPNDPRTWVENRPAGRRPDTCVPGSCRSSSPRVCSRSPTSRCWRPPTSAPR